MEKTPPEDTMTPSLLIPRSWGSEPTWQQTALLWLIPMLLAAGLIDTSAREGALPEAESYRTPLSDTLFESNRWRIPQEETRDWRLPLPPPPLGWRSPSTALPETSSSPRTIELFPRYQPGKSSDYDFNAREEKPLIKMFEFGSK